MTAAKPSPEPNSAAPRYQDIPNWDLLRLLPLDVQTVVDVGCNAGALGSHYKRLNPNAHYTGLEIDAAVATIARGRLDHVEVVNVEDAACDRLFAPGSLDCIVYGDMLEHAIDPWSLLARHKHWLSDRGTIVACIPNIQHWSIITELLRGQWTYRQTGLLDRTHLRFFTLDSIKQLFEGAGLEIVSLFPRYGNRETCDRVVGALQEVCDLLGVDRDTLGDRMAALQYIVRARKPAPQPLRRLLIQTAIFEPVACKRVRVSEPDAFLARIPGVRVHSSEKSASIGIDLPGEEPVFIWQRAILSKERNLDHLRLLLRRNYLIGLEIDDDPMRWSGVTDTDFFGYRACHFIQTSTERLAEFLRQINPNVAVFPNAIATLPPPRQHDPDPSAPITLFFGALNRRKDWLPLLPSLNRILTDRGDRVRVEVVFDREFFDALATPHKTFQPLIPFDTYAETLSRCDVALLPLTPTRFNVMKSDLSFLECASRGVAVLASPVVYGETIRDGETALLFHTPDRFERCLAALLDRPDLRQRIANNAYTWVRQHRMLADCFRDRYDTYCYLRDRLPELNASLRDRVPELFADSPNP